MPALKKKIISFGDDDKNYFPLSAPDKRYPAELAVFQNIFWQLKHEKSPKDDVLKILFLFSPKVRLAEDPHEGMEFCITAKEYAELTGLKVDSAYTILNRVVDALYEHSVIFYHSDKDRDIRTRLINSCSYKDGCFLETALLFSCKNKKLNIIDTFDFFFSQIEKANYLQTISTFSLNNILLNSCNYNQLDVAKYLLHSDKLPFKADISFSDFDCLFNAYYLYKKGKTETFIYLNEQYDYLNDKEFIKPSLKEKIKKDGIPYGLWDTYRKRYNWRFDVQFYKEEDKLTDPLAIEYINGEYKINK